ncbi:ATP-binding protein [Caballeronia sordidicola]|uniref:ATP-binding protein n=1 Tax=Caballeronia sordidicola TaxID=196367 RepID=UPI00068A616B|nr:transporter substrate-binding domain-containing protein [Caballeronia sordidicola]
MSLLRTHVAIQSISALRQAMVFACLLALSIAVNAATPKPFIVGAVPGALPPMEMNDPDDSSSGVRGVSADFAQRVAIALQRPLEWRTFPDRSAMLDALRHHRIDAATSATGNDAGPALRHSRPYVATKQVFVERRVAGRRTGRVAYVEQQTSVRQLHDAYPALHAVGYRDTLSALLAVSLGDADAFVGDLATTGYTIDHLDLVSLTISGFAAFDEAGYSFAFAADAAGDIQRQRVDAALAALPPRFLLEVRARWAAAAAVTFTRPLTLSDAQRAWISAHPVIDYSMYADAAPMTFRDSSGKPAGLAIDMLAAIGALTGLSFEGRLHGSTAQVTDDLGDGRASLIAYGLSAGQIPPQFAPTKPYGEGVLVILTRAGSQPLRDAQALAGKRVALWRNHALMSELRERVPSVRIVETSPINGQFDAVVNGQADATIIDLTFANYAVGNPYRNKLVITGAFSDQPVQHGFLIARNQPMLLAIMNRAIEHMQPTELDAIRRRWMLIEHPESQWERRRPQVIFGALLGAAMLALLIGWAVSLKAQIARRRAAEHAMRAAKEEAETANRAKSTFLATMSHEIRTPMNAVLGLLELELRSPGDRASTERALGTAHHAAHDLLGMIDDILDMAKIEAGRLVLTPAPLELGEWVKSVVAIYEPAARSKGVALVVRMRGHREHERVWVMADGLRLRQVLGNLLSNAIKFTDAGQVTLEYAIGAVRKGHAHTPPAANALIAHRELLLAVSDTGIGIAADQQALLFAPFAQARQERPGRFGGTGLGLTICRRLMTMMGGTIRLSSKPGQGSRFTARVRLPVGRQPLETPVSMSELDTHDLLGLHVLVVDDHPANRILLASQLNTLGCVLETANDGEAAFARWERKRQDGAQFDLILTDCSMPTMSGEDLARAIRARELALTRPNAHIKPTPIIGVTANAQPEALTQALGAGMTLCLVKPLGLDALHRALVLAMHDERRPKVAALTAALPVATRAGDPTLPSDSRSFFDRVLGTAPMHMSTASIGAARSFTPGVAHADTYGPTQTFPANRAVGSAVSAALNVSVADPGKLTSAFDGPSDTAPKAAQPVDHAGAALGTSALPSTIPRFNVDQLNGFGDQAAALVDALKSANRQDLEEARRAFASADFRRLLELVHRMKGAAFVIGATSFSDACLSLQHACVIEPGHGYNTAAIRAAYARFHAEAIALHAALEQHPA